MEIADYLKVARRRLIMLIVVPLLAGALAAAYILLSPRPYTATAYVSAPSLVGGQFSAYDGPRGAEQFVNDFTATATSPAVANAVAGQTDASAQDVMENTAVTRVGLSSRVELTYTSPDRDQADSVVNEVAVRTIEQMFGPPVRLAQARVDAAAKSLHQANQAAADFAPDNGSLPVDQRYAALTEQISRLQEQQAIYDAQGLTFQADALGETIDEKQATLAGLTTVNTRYQDLLAEREAAQASLAAAHQKLAEARAQLAAADPDQAVQALPARMQPLAPVLAARTLTAVGMGLLLAIGLVVVLELLARRSPAAEPAVGSAGGRRVSAEGQT